MLVIIAAASFLFYKNFPFHGTLMYTDMTWPSSMQRVSFQVANAWYPYGSFPTTNYLMSFFWIYPSSLVARLVGFSAPQYMLVVFLATFSFAGISMYALAYHTIGRIKLPESARYAPFVGAVFAALIFMYNPWSLQYFRPYFVYPLYAAMPLLFLAMVKTIDSPSLRNIVLFSLFLAVVNTSYLMYWFWGILVTYFIFHLASNRFERESVKKAFKAGFGILVFYLLFNAIWLVPSAMSLISGKPFVPFYAPGFSQVWLKAFSANNTIMNNLRLISNWDWRLSQVGGGTTLEVLVFAIPILSILALVLLRHQIRRSRIINYWALMALGGLLLATGTSFILRRPYNYLAFKAPGSASLGWTLRAPERWLFFVPVFFALMLGLLVAWFLVKRPQALRWRDISRIRRSEDEDFTSGGKHPPEAPSETGGTLAAKADKLELTLATKRYRRNLTVAIVVIAIVLVSLYPVAHDFAQKVFSPVVVPSDYQEADNFVNRKGGEPRVAWLPFFPPGNYVYKWAPEKKIFPYSVITSNPSLSSIQEVLNSNSYFKWFESLYLKQEMPPVQIVDPGATSGNGVTSRLLAPFASQYLIFDSSVDGFDFGNSLEADASLTRVLKTKFLSVYKTDYDPGYITAAARTVKVNTFFDNLSLIQKLTDEQLRQVAFFNGPSYFGGPSTIGDQYGVIDLNKYLIPLTVNSGFEKSEAGGTPAGWYQLLTNKETNFSIDSTTKPAHGKSSLRVVNASKDAGSLSWVTTWEEPVQHAGDMYTFEAEVKYQNADWTNAGIEGYRPDLHQWVLIARCPNILGGTAGWKKYSCSFLVPAGYSSIRPALGAGWTKEPARGPAISWFDNVKLSKVDSSLFSDMTNGGKPPDVSFKKVNSEKYAVSVKGATRPFILVLAEAFDNHWVVTMENGKKIDPVPMYKTINGFPIDRQGDFDLTIEYQPQEWFSIGLWISLTAMFVSLLCLLILWYRRGGKSSRLARTFDRISRRIGSAIHAYEFRLRPRRSRSKVKNPGAGVSARARDVLAGVRRRTKSLHQQAGYYVRYPQSKARDNASRSKPMRDWLRSKKHVVYWVGAVLIAVLFATLVSLTSAIVISFFLLGLLLEIDSGVPLAIALILLLVCPLLLVIKQNSSAEILAVWAYYFLAIGIILQFIDYMRSVAGKRTSRQSKVDSRSTG